MALEQIDAITYRMEPGGFDPHGHPRAADALTPDDFGLGNGCEGKAGFYEYTLEALESGITVVNAMPNEQMRLYNPAKPEQTEVVPYPIANLDRVRFMQARASSEAVVPVGLYLGLDPTQCFVEKNGKQKLNKTYLEEVFAEAGCECLGLKIYGGETTGGFNIQTKFIPDVVLLWYAQHPEKPSILHLEDENVQHVLGDLSYRLYGKQAPVHVAHVSSRQELEAVIGAKKAGMNVSCEVTPHHLFLTSDVEAEIGGYARMKPTLKAHADSTFLWANLKYIDMFASDHAPHRRSDKESANPAYGVKNHREMLPLLFAAVGQGRLTIDELYEKFCLAARRRFNLPLQDGSHVAYKTDTATSARSLTRPRGQFSNDAFLMLELERMRTGRYDSPAMLGHIVSVAAGKSSITPSSREIHTSYTHLIRPTNLGHVALL